MKKIKEELVVYAVKSHDGKWYRSKGPWQNQTGEHWVDDFDRAKIFRKVGGARGVCTYYAGHYPEYPPPLLVKLIIGEVVVMDETKRIAAARAKILQKDLDRQLNNQKYYEAKSMAKVQ